MKDLIIRRRLVVTRSTYFINTFMLDGEEPFGRPQFDAFMALEGIDIHVFWAWRHTIHRSIFARP